MASTPQYPQDPQPEPHVTAVLRSMGLASDELRASIRAGHDLASRFTSNDVATRAGFNRWAEPLRYLGDTYVPKGFKRERPGGFEVLRSPDDSFDIAIAPGSYATGMADRMPSTRVERGPLTGQAVFGNRDQLRFDSNVIPFAPNEPRPDAQPQRRTWLLLHFLDDVVNELRVELSVPIEFTTKSGTDTERGNVTRFDPRLILPATPLADLADLEDEDEDDDEIDISVDRR